MKRIYFILTVLAAVSCSKAEPGTQAEESEVMTFTAIGENTKMTMDYPATVWQSGDRIKVYNNVDSAEFSVVESSISGNSCEFKGGLKPGDGTFYAIYPASAAISCTSGSIRAVLPTNQFIPDGGNSDPRALLCVAQSTSNTLAFKNVCGMIRVTISGNDITGIVLEGNNNEVLSGVIDITPGDTPSYTVVEGCTRIDVRAEDYGTLAAGTYYIPVLPGTLASGIKIGVRRAGCLETPIGTNTSIAIARNAGITVKNVDMTIVGKDSTVVLRCRHDFEEITASGRFAASQISLGNDVDMESVNWTPRQFSGTFDGQNHTIYNIVCEAADTVGFFSGVTGVSTIRDVNFGKQDDNSIFRYINHLASSWSGIICIASGTLNISNVNNYVSFEECAPTAGQGTNYAGALVGYCSAKGSIENCSNYGDITFSPKAWVNGAVPYVNLAGIIARAKDGIINLKYCKNYGTVKATLGTSTASVSLCLSGIICRADANISIENCENHGEIINNAGNSGSSSYTFIAGIVARSGNTIMVNDCLNDAAVSNSGASTSLNMGGIGGQICGAAQSSVCQTCTNSGTITNTGTGTRYVGGIVGDHTQADATHVAKVLSCTNSGTISDNVSGGTINLGGVVGRLLRAQAEIGSCTGSGTIDVPETRLTHCGAICGVNDGVISGWTLPVGTSVGGHAVTAEDLYAETLTENNYKYLRGTSSKGAVSEGTQVSNLDIDDLSTDTDGNAW